MEKYHVSARILHWVMAVLIVGLLGAGIWMADFLAKDAVFRGQVYALHKSFGVVALILVVLRIFNRFYRKPPALCEEFSVFERWSAHFVHILLYVLMVAIPLSGYVMSNGYGYEVHLFGLKMPNLLGKNVEIGQIAGKIHKFGAYAIILALILHVAGALKHHFIDKNPVLKKIC